MKIFKIISSLFVLASTSASASITFDIQAESLRTAGGAIPSNALVLLIADTTGNGFSAIQAGASLNVGAFLNGDDQILYRNTTQATSGLGDTFAGFTSTPLNLSGNWNAGDALALLWFPGLDNTATTVANGDTYGQFSGPAANGSSAWVTPADGSSAYKLYFFTSNATNLTTGGANAATTGYASNSVGVVPEPSRAILGFVGLAALFLRRRR